LARILFVDHVGVLSGAEWSLLDIARAHRDSCLVVLLADGPFRHRLQQEQIPCQLLIATESITRVKRQGSRMQVLGAVPAIIPMVIRLARLSRSFDILYANTQKAFVVAALSGWLARRPVVWHLRDIMTAAHFGPLQRRLTVRLANMLCAKIIANSEATGLAFVQAGGKAHLVTVVPNGISPEPFDSIQDSEVESLKTDLGITGVPIVGIFSRTAPWKGQHVAIEALKSVPNAHLVIVGDALFGEHEYLRDLHDLAAQCGVTDRVHFLGFRNDVPVLMKTCDVIVQPSISPEPFGRVVVEGMLARRAVVATRGGGPSEIISSGHTGELVDPDNGAALAERIAFLLEDEEYRTNLGEAAYTVARERYTVEKLVDSTDRIIATILQENGDAPTEKSFKGFGDVE
jgi:glycosyltransferase involved in cell wall biosynthesis